MDAAILVQNFQYKQDDFGTKQNSFYHVILFLYLVYN